MALCDLRNSLSRIFNGRGLRGIQGPALEIDRVRNSESELMARRTTEGAKFIENFGANRFFQLKAFVAAFGADFDNVLKAVNTLNSKELSELRRISRACGSARYRLKPQEVALLERLGSSFGSVAAPARTVGSGLAAILTRADRLPNQTELSNWLEHINYQGGAPSEARESLLADGIGA